MFRFFLSFTLLLLFTACNPNSSILISQPPTKKVLDEDTIVRIPIPFKESGYSHITTKLYTSQKDFTTFLEKVKQQKYWQERAKTNFISSLKINPIDFTKYNLLIYIMAESSSANKLTIDPPKGDNAHVEININRETPKEGQRGTADMAYYALAYKIKKSVIDITFDNGVKKEIILNNNIQLASDGKVPKECLAWYDGCNDCMRKAQEVVCTERYCVHHDKFRCTKWRN